MFGISGLGPGGLLIAAAALIVWILILVWLSEKILQFVGKRTAWGPLDPRNMVGSFLLLLGAIHFGNYALDLLESAMGGRSAEAALTFPNAFLIGSVAIAVGVAAIRWRRKQQ